MKNRESNYQNYEGTESRYTEGTKVCLDPLKVLFNKIIKGNHGRISSGVKESPCTKLLNNLGNKEEDTFHRMSKSD